MIKPLNNNVVLKKDKVEQKTTSGIILSSKSEDTEYARVIAKGKGKRNSDGSVEEIDVNVGDKVIYKSYSPTKVKVNDEEYLIVSSDDILAVLD